MGEMNALIVGAGISGLTCAISLARHQGVRVTVLEKAPTLCQVGNGIQVPCNAAHVLKSLGLLERFSAIAGGPSPGSWSMDYRTGKVLLKRDFGPCERLYGVPLVHRQDYMNLLLEEAIRLGVDIKTGCDVQEVNLEATSITLANGQVYTADVIIGCDGVHSSIRAALHPNIQVHTSSMIAYRCVLTIPQLAAASSSLRNLLTAPMCRMWLGPRSHAVVYPLRQGTMLNLVLIINDDPFNKRCRHGDRLRLLREWVKDWDPVVKEIVDLTPSLDSFPLRELPELPTWSKGSVAIAGDAAHPTTPFLAQGAAMAVEDAHILGTMLGQLSQREPRNWKKHIPAILRSYTDLQRSRTTRIVRNSRKHGAWDHMLPGKERDARDREFANFDMETCVSECPWIDARMNRELLGRRAGDLGERELGRLLAAEAEETKRIQQKPQRGSWFKNWSRRLLKNSPLLNNRGLGVAFHAGLFMACLTLCGILARPDNIPRFEIFNH
ncbi:FAD-dependent monooxygenase OpS4 [Cladobotryum mycophilum]|uniref:FAD-dependent monooxygenase OpS4 n=1 Tax=Cladobotryum mycophilum TaxID=491253 RepID=A0ABR0SU00_9HYPO